MQTFASMMKTLPILLPVALLLSISGCSIVQRWNIVFGGVEFSDALSFNHDGVGIHVERFGVINGGTIGLLVVRIGNFTTDTLRINTHDFVLTIGTDTLHAEPAQVDTVVIAPGRRGEVDA